MAYIRVKKIKSSPKNKNGQNGKFPSAVLGGEALNKFDFSYDEYQRFLERCPFTEDELLIIAMRRSGKSVTQIAFKLNVSERTVGRKIKDICKKILKEI